MTADLDPRQLEAFRERLSTGARVRIDRTDLWEAFARSFPGRPGGAAERRLLVTALEALAASGILTLPAKRGSGWERIHGVDVPTWVSRKIQDRAEPQRGWRDFPWHPRLDWVADLPRLSDEQEAFLRKVHEGLVMGQFSKLVPMKYRSLQLTATEKRLGELVKGNLFGPGRLDYELLGCVPETLPMSWESVSEEPTILVFENAAPFAVAREVLCTLRQSPYGMVGYGAGRSFPWAIRHLRSIGRSIRTIHYVGDLDWPGLTIAIEAAAAAVQVGLPRVEPAPGLHLAMLESARNLGVTEGWQIEDPTGRAACPDPRGLQFLPVEIRNFVQAVLDGGRRIPEEVLGPDELADVWSR